MSRGPSTLSACAGTITDDTRTCRLVVPWSLQPAPHQTRPALRRRNEVILNDALHLRLTVVAEHQAIPSEAPWGGEPWRPRYPPNVSRRAQPRAPRPRTSTIGPRPLRSPNGRAPSRTVGIQANRHEARHRLARSVFRGRRGDRYHSVGSLEAGIVVSATGPTCRANHHRSASVPNRATTPAGSAVLPVDVECFAIVEEVYAPELNGASRLNLDSKRAPTKPWRASRSMVLDALPGQSRLPLMGLRPALTALVFLPQRGARFHGARNRPRSLCRLAGACKHSPPQ